MTNKNTAALARFGELYKTAWTRLSERHDEIPHFTEIAASFDKITATQQGRDLVHLFAETRSAAFRTAGDDLVATRNRAAFIVALAQYKKELAAPAAPAATKPAPRCSLYPIENPGATSRIEEDNGKLYLCIINGALQLDVVIDGFFPLAQPNEKKILPHIAGALSAETASRLYKILCDVMDYLNGTEKKRLAHNMDTLADLLAQRPGFENIAAEYKTAASKTTADVDRGVKVSGKPEPFYTFRNTQAGMVYAESMGYKATKAGFTFYIYKFCGTWYAVEETTGLSATNATTKTRVIESLKDLDMDHLKSIMPAARKRSAELMARCNAAA